MKNYQALLDYYTDNAPNPEWEGFAKFVFNSQQLKIEDLQYRVAELEALASGNGNEFLKGEYEPCL